MVYFNCITLFNCYWSILAEKWRKFWKIVNAYNQNTDRVLIRIFNVFYHWIFYFLRQYLSWIIVRPVYLCTLKTTIEVVIITYLCISLINLQSIFGTTRLIVVMWFCFFLCVFIVMFKIKKDKWALTYKLKSILFFILRTY